MKNKVLTIFAFYDNDKIIDDYVIFYLKELKKISDIIFVSDCDILREELNKIKDYTIHIINGRHYEYDFGSYKRGYLYASKNNILYKYDNLILCNDSCYGPFFNIVDIINRMTSFDFGGLYLSKDLKIASHNYISSFFIIMGRKIFKDDIFYKFIKSIQKEEDKMDIIKKYEFGLSKLMIDNNIKLQSLFNDNNEFNRPYFNPLALIKEGFPLLKRHCLEKNITVPLNIDELREIINMIKPYYDINLIVNHLNRIADKKQIQYLFQKYKPYKKVFISEKIFQLSTKYSMSGSYQFNFKFFNTINLAVNKSLEKSYLKTNYNNFSFLL